MLTRPIPLKNDFDHRKGKGQTSILKQQHSERPKSYRHRNNSFLYPQQKFNFIESY